MQTGGATPCVNPCVGCLQAGAPAPWSGPQGLLLPGPPDSKMLSAQGPLMRNPGFVLGSLAAEHLCYAASP